MENACYSCSSLSSPKRKSSMILDSLCVCSLTSAKTVTSLDHSIGGITRLARDETHSTDNVKLRRYERGVRRRRVRQRADLRVRLKSVQLPNQLHAELGEPELKHRRLHLKEFWSELKCENFPSTPQTIEKIWTKSEQYPHNNIATSRKTKNSDHYDYSDSGSEINVNAINDETDVYIDEDSNVLGHGHIKTEVVHTLTKKKKRLNLQRAKKYQALSIRESESIEDSYNSQAITITSIKLIARAPPLILARQNKKYSPLHRQTKSRHATARANKSFANFFH
ncbi:hypothetical protein WN51_01944 [Melipona quadrifasciata]|uniref:Uncharacterized protein n=1 Tax=Melipona quadrifasciata TaxID=166423 RepID=A0A0M8ZYX5_9HYME|nr:hypothetical protein WN51_01944 [Melipona quadrifasciata]